MNYNILIQSFTGSFNILDLTEDDLIHLVDGYHQGKNTVTIGGRAQTLSDVQSFLIFTNESGMSAQEFQNSAVSQDQIIRSKLYPKAYYIPKSTLATNGKEVTKDFLGNFGFGEKKQQNSQEIHTLMFINQSRIEELRSCSNQQFDLAKLVRICEEINSNYSFGNYFSVGILGRAILDHVPPIFGCDTFAQYSSSAGRSVKKQMQKLEVEVRSIADALMHLPIRRKEPLPNSTTVNYQSLLDILLQEIIRICH